MTLRMAEMVTKICERVKSGVAVSAGEAGDHVSREPVASVDGIYEEGVSKVEGQEMQGAYIVRRESLSYSPGSIIHCISPVSSLTSLCTA